MKSNKDSFDLDILWFLYIIMSGLLGFVLDSNLARENLSDTIIIVIFWILAGAYLTYQTISLKNRW